MGQEILWNTRKTQECFLSPRLPAAAPALVHAGTLAVHGFSSENHRSRVPHTGIFALLAGGSAGLTVPRPVGSSLHPAVAPGVTAAHAGAAAPAGPKSFTNFGTASIFNVVAFP